LQTRRWRGVDSKFQFRAIPGGLACLRGPRSEQSASAPKSSSQWFAGRRTTAQFSFRWAAGRAPKLSSLSVPSSARVRSPLHEIQSCARSSAVSFATQFVRAVNFAPAVAAMSCGHLFPRRASARAGSQDATKAGSSSAPRPNAGAVSRRAETRSVAISAGCGLR